MKSTSGDSVEMSVLMSMPDGLSLPVFWTFCVASLRIVGLQWTQSPCLCVVLDSLSFAWLLSLFCGIGRPGDSLGCFMGFNFHFL